MARKLGIDLHYLNELRQWFPLAAEGEAHKLLREKFAREIAQNSSAALAGLAAELESRRALLEGIAPGEEFCFYAKRLCDRR